MTCGYCLLVLREFEAAAEAFRGSDLLSEGQLKPVRRRALNGLGICLTGLGQFEEAEKALISSSNCAREIADPVATSNSINNLGCLYMARGLFLQARTCFRTAIEDREGITSPHAITNVLANAAELAIVLANRPEAEMFESRADESARRSGLWRDRVVCLLIKADICLAQGRVSDAWDLVDKISKIMRESRQDLECDQGRLARLRRLSILSEMGYEEMLRFTPPLYEKARLEDRLEIKCTELWAAQQAGTSDDEAVALLLNEIESAGLYGLLARLHALHIMPFELDAQPGEASAQMVARIFLHQSPDQVPDSVF